MMKKKIFTLTLACLCFLIFNPAFAQTDTAKRNKLLGISGIVYDGFTSGKVKEIFKPQFSSNLGVDILFKKSNFFLTTLVDILSFGYYQDYTEKPQDPYRIKNGSSTFYLLEVTPGYRKTIKQWSLYGFAGPGAGLINLPNASIDNTLQTVTIVNNYSWTVSAKAGLGIDYSIGEFVAFLQGGYIHTFKQVQNRDVNIFPIYIGLKSNISGILKSSGAK